jgi:hypothetical protein
MPRSTSTQRIHASYCRAARVDELRLPAQADALIGFPAGALRRPCTRYLGFGLRASLSRSRGRKPQSAVNQMCCSCGGAKAWLGAGQANFRRSRGRGGQARPSAQFAADRGSSGKPSRRMTPHGSRLSGVTHGTFSPTCSRRCATSVTMTTSIALTSWESWEFGLSLQPCRTRPACGRLARSTAHTPSARP